jgi:hypothetical protein
MGACSTIVALIGMAEAMPFPVVVDGGSCITTRKIPRSAKKSAALGMMSSFAIGEIPTQAKSGLAWGTRLHARSLAPRRKALRPG